MTKTTVHVFLGNFLSIEEATNYTEAQWEAEPDAIVSDKEYTEWENRNPVWLMKNDLKVYLDSDFIETIEGETRFEYLEEILSDKKSIREIRNINYQSNILVLIFKKTLGGFNADLTSTNLLHYCGEYDCII